MRRNRFAVAAAIFALSTVGSLARAADHRDGPGTLTDPTVDITDVYAWMSADGAKVYLVMDLQGANTGAAAMTRFSDKALYALHVDSRAKYGDAAAKTDTIICSFDAMPNQGFRCWGPGATPDYVAGTVGDKAGKSSASGKIKVAALVRNDPFWFNIRGFLAVASTVKQVAGNLMFDPAGCPKLDAQTSALLVNTLKSDGAMGAGVDDFAKNGKAPVASKDPMAVTNGNVLSIVLEVDKTLLTTGGSLVSVWGSTNMPQ